ncbi:transposase [Kitasatospora sp. NE20-6]|uniref:transposase n=1 Tax=Kitasatospora sp. NE20-6 TaxID=2859066 RepID=UPI0038B362ED
MRDFRPSPNAVDTRWCGDITYVPTDQGWLYLATVIDIASRRVVGWATASHLRTELVSDALRAACHSRRPDGPVIFHSDRGCQGGFNRSLQHLVLGGVDGPASWMDAGVDGAVADEVAGCACASAGGRARVLA